MDDASTIILGRELIEPRHRGEVLLETWRLKLRILQPQVVTGEPRRRRHAPSEKTAAQSAVGKYAHRIFPAIRQNIFLNVPFEQIVWRLGGMQRSNGPEGVHLCRTEVAHANRPDFASLQQGLHRL